MRVLKIFKNSTELSRACAARVPTLLKAMGKEACPSKIHFARCVTKVEGRPDKVTWKCEHCGKHVISGAFRAANARIHLAAEKTEFVAFPPEIPEEYPLPFPYTTQLIDSPFNKTEVLFHPTFPYKTHLTFVLLLKPA